MLQAILTFDDGLVNQYTTVSPILRSLGFGATFFIGKWIAGDCPEAESAPHCLSISQLRKLRDEGFELGNHTLNHPDLNNLEPADIRAEITGIEAMFARLGIPRPTVFAYPGGPYSPGGAEILKELGYRGARTTEPRAWNPAADDPLRLPAFPITEKYPDNFSKALAALDETHPVILVYHGIPDERAPWCNVSIPDFLAQMNRLRELGIAGVGLTQSGRLR